MNTLQVHYFFRPPSDHPSDRADDVMFPYLAMCLLRALPCNQSSTVLCSSSSFIFIQSAKWFRSFYPITRMTMYSFYVHYDLKSPAAPTVQSVSNYLVFTSPRNEGGRLVLQSQMRLAPGTVQCSYWIETTPNDLYAWCITRTAYPFRWLLTSYLTASQLHPTVTVSSPKQL